MMENKKWEKENARKVVCWNCKERHPKCHAECEKYIEESNLRRRENQALTDDKMRTKMFGKKDRRKQPSMRRY